MACWALGTPGYSWQVTAQSGIGIGHAGMPAAARTLALAGLYLVDQPDVVKEARKEFDAKTAGRKYKSVMPPEPKPPVFPK
jgi:aminobenzoyl-glutamate utilization protein B